jgi:hypothetical protein
MGESALKKKKGWSYLSTFQASVFSLAWKILFRAPGVFIGIAFASFLVTTAISIGVEILQIPTSTLGTVSAFYALLANLIPSVMIQGAVAYAVFQVIDDRRASIRESVLRFASKFLALLTIAILTTIGVALGSILLIVGIVVQCMWHVSASVCVVERLGPIKSLRRSRALTEGYRWQVFGMMFLSIMFIGLVEFLSLLLVGVLVVDNDIFLQDTIGQIIAGLAALIPYAFANVASTVTYYRLRVVKEGLTVENLADVFD